ncbi:hypothetical protein B0H34DRAFT_75033 [Crassisporium funariophilum]|nr:hypothetical protein B0H34DRAFT_75033 [Crassisporium funariophilum]
MSFKSNENRYLSKAEEMRPFKRRRMEMAPPDGFLTTTGPPKPALKPSVPKFSSAFNEGSTSKHDPQTERDKTANRKQNHILRTLVPPKLVYVPLQDGAHLLQSDTGKFQPASSTALALNNSSTPSHLENARIAQCQSMLGESSQIFRPPPRPLSEFADISTSLNSGTKPSTHASHLVRPPPAFKAYAVPSTSKPSLQQAVPPPQPIPNKPLSKALKSVRPPPIPEPHNVRSDRKDLRTILTTSVARATDLSTENGPAELASIFLHDQQPDMSLLSSYHDNHDKRGLELSPEKKGKWKTPKLIRGGLAARASAHFDRSHMSLILWHKGTERGANILASSDLRVEIIKILHKPLPSRTTSKQSICSPGIALCRIQSTHASVQRTYKLDNLYRMVFPFANPPMNHDPENFTEGRMVQIYWPWQEINFSLMKEDRAVVLSLPVLPATLPLPSSEPSPTPNPLDAPINDNALLCSRFLFLS